jgi:serine protease Do
MGNVGAWRQRLAKMAWVAIAAALVGVVSASMWLGRPSSDAADAAVPSEVAQLEALQRGFAWIAETIKPSVVFVEVEQKRGKEMPQSWRELLPPDFPWIPRVEPTPPVPPVGQGSGVVVDPSGYIITNDHVVGSAVKITVHLVNGESYAAELVGADELTDLAVIKIQPERPLTAAELGDADESEVGSWVMAVGYPFGGGRYGGRFDEAFRYEPTVTVGVISAKERQIESERQGYPFRDLIQTDAPINVGNSGGPLVNIHAEVVGINQAIYTGSPWRGNVGVGFAIPINGHTKDVIETLKGGEPVVRGRLGVQLLPLTEPRRKVYNARHGVFVEAVEPDGPADQAGIREDDIITKYRGNQVTSGDDLVNEVRQTKPGTTVEVEVLRDGKPLSLQVTVEALSLQPPAKQANAPERHKLGLAVESLPAEEAQRMRVPGGVRVRSVEPLSDAARSGIQPGDVITKINRQEVTDLESYRGAVDQLKKGDPVVIRLLRRNRSHTAEIEALSE